MVCTVITATAGPALAGLVAILAMVILLIFQELSDAREVTALRLLSRHLTVAVIPLFVASVFIFIMELLQILS
jgi:hypothetical protein